MNGRAKSPDAALRFAPRPCGVRQSTPHPPRFARPACGTFCTAVRSGKTLRAVGTLALLAAVLALGGCAGLPNIEPLEPALKSAAQDACGRPFLKDKYRLVHALKAVMPGDREGMAIGILAADPRTGSFQSVLMTIEGLVLFDIVYARSLSVNRAVPPFDAPSFARRMAEDIGLAFFSPGGEPAAWGRTAAGDTVCRFERPGGEFVDVLSGQSGALEIRLYGSGKELRKKVSIPRVETPGLADELEIRGTGWPSYSLHLRLIEAERIED